MVNGKKHFRMSKKNTVEEMFFQYHMGANAYINPEVQNGTQMTSVFIYLFVCLLVFYHFGMIV